MSGAQNAQWEAEGFLYSMAIDPLERFRNVKVGRIFDKAVASVVEFGEDAVHPTLTDETPIEQANVLLDAHTELGFLLTGHFVVDDNAMTTDQKPASGWRQ